MSNTTRLPVSSSGIEPENERIALGIRIRESREVRKLSRSDAAAQLGVSISTFQAWEAGDREPDSTKLAAFVRRNSISIEWLLFGEGEMLKGQEPSIEAPCACRQAPAGEAVPFWPNPHGEPQIFAWERWAAQIDREDFVPVIYAPKLCAAAGSGVVNYMDEQETEALMFKRGFLRHLGVQPYQVFCMRVKGDSMVPTLLNGSVILVDTAQCRISEGIYVIRVDDELMVKRLQRTADRAIRVSSDNTAYSSYNVHPNAQGGYDLDVIGRAIHLNTKI